MPFIATNPEKYKGIPVGSGQCVAFVQESSGAPLTKYWSEGIKVRGSQIPAGTAIATFKNGVYPSNATGNHAAIYISQDSGGITVWDQWTGRPVDKRHIRFQEGQASSNSNDGDAYSVIE